MGVAEFLISSADLWKMLRKKISMATSPFVSFCQQLYILQHYIITLFREFREKCKNIEKFTK